jgi:predicted nucleic acid-binding protein
VIVADVNLLAYLWIGGERTEEAVEVLRKDPTWVVPPLWRSEFRNLLLGYVRRKALSLDSALELLSRVEAQLRGHEIGVPSDRVFRLAQASTLTAYDAEYVALAFDLGIPLVTCDKQILREYPKLAMDPRTFAKSA